MCGRVRVTITQAPLLAMACHCIGCQKLTSAPFSISLAIPTGGYEITGELERGGLHGDHEQLYCGHCKNWIITKPAGLDWFANIRATVLDDHAWFVPYLETMTSEKLPWATTAAKHSFEGFPGLEEYAPLVESFASEGARPG